MKLSKVWSIVRTVTVCAALVSTGITVAYAGTPVIWPAICTGLWMMLSMVAAIRSKQYAEAEDQADYDAHVAELVDLGRYYDVRLAASVGFDEYVKTEKSAPAVGR